MGNSTEAKLMFSIFPKTQLSFPNMESFEQYIKDEIRFWENIDESIKLRYDDILALTRKIRNVSDTEKENIFCQISRLLDTGECNNNIHFCVYSKSALGQYLAKLHKNDPGDYKTTAPEIVSLNFTDETVKLSSARRDLPVNSSLFRNLLKSYFLFNVETIANTDLSIYKKNLKELLSEIAQTNIDMKNELAQNKKTFANSINTDQKTFQEMCNTISQKEQVFEGTFENQLQTWNKNIEALEETYNEKLQLEEPAKYWQKLASEYRKWGGIYVVADIFAAAFFAFILILLLINSDWIPVFSREKFDMNVVRGCLLLLAMSSVLGFIIHILTKFALSSYHLARDYEERFQLTKVYLALLKNDSIKDNEQVKSIVMQSLFCRADTGLLKGEHSSQMPSPLTEILKGDMK